MTINKIQIIEICITAVKKKLALEKKHLQEIEQKIINLNAEKQALEATQAKEKAYWYLSAETEKTHQILKNRILQADTSLIHEIAEETRQSKKRFGKNKIEAFHEKLKEQLQKLEITNLTNNFTTTPAKNWPQLAKEIIQKLIKVSIQDSNPILIRNSLENYEKQFKLHIKKIYKKEFKELGDALTSWPLNEIDKQKIQEWKLIKEKNWTSIKELEEEIKRFAANGEKVLGFTRNYMEIKFDRLLEQSICLVEEPKLEEQDINYLIKIFSEIILNLSDSSEINDINKRFIINNINKLIGDLQSFNTEKHSIFSIIPQEFFADLGNPVYEAYLQFLKYQLSKIFDANLLDKLIQLAIGKYGEVLEDDDIKNIEHLHTHADTDNFNLIKYETKRIKEQRAEKLQLTIHNFNGKNKNIPKALEDYQEREQKITEKQKEIKEKERLLKEYKEIVLDLLKAQIKFAFDYYVKSNVGISKDNLSNKLFASHNHNGYLRAESLKKNILESTDYHNACQLLTDFLEKNSGLRDTSFITILLTELYHPSHGFLTRNIPSQNQKDGKEILEEMTRQAKERLEMTNGQIKNKESRRTTLFECLFPCFLKSNTDNTVDITSLLTTKRPKLIDYFHRAPKDRKLIRECAINTFKMETNKKRSP